MTQVAKHQAVKKRPYKCYDRGRIDFAIPRYPLSLGYDFKSTSVRLVCEKSRQYVGTFIMFIEVCILNQRNIITSQILEFFFHLFGYISLDYCKIFCPAWFSSNFQDVFGYFCG